jgi:hypothetical protein
VAGLDRDDASSVEHRVAREAGPLADVGGRRCLLKVDGGVLEARGIRCRLTEGEPGARRSFAPELPAQELHVLALLGRHCARKLQEVATERPAAQRSVVEGRLRLLENEQELDDAKVLSA